MNKIDAVLTDDEEEIVELFSELDFTTRQTMIEILLSLKDMNIIHETIFLKLLHLDLYKVSQEDMKILETLLEKYT